jgi:hypothetical protein
VIHSDTAYGRAGAAKPLRGPGVLAAVWWRSEAWTACSGLLASQAGDDHAECLGLPLCLDAPVAFEVESLD